MVNMLNFTMDIIITDGKLVEQRAYGVDLHTRSGFHAVSVHTLGVSLDPVLNAV